MAVTCITYIEFNGTEHVADVPEGWSVMQGAINNSIPGIDATCGGACACATCHVFVDPGWLKTTGLPSESEAELLEFADGVAPNSRLACQIEVTAALDGLIVRMPRTQV